MKIKGFTLVELIVVLAIFGMIMAAALSMINPVGELYKSTSDYETARSSSSNVRQYVEENIKYADRFAVVVNSDAYPTNEVNTFINYFVKTVGPGTDNPVYVMKIENDEDKCSGNTNGNLNVISNAKGKVSLYKNNTLQSDFAVNYNMYSDFGFEFILDTTKFGSKNLSMDVNIYPINKKSRVDTGTGFTFDYIKKDDGTAPYSTTATFSMINAVDKREVIEYYRKDSPFGSVIISKDDILPGWVPYYTEDGVEHGDYEICEGEMYRIVDNSATSGSFKDGVCDLAGTSKDIYFIYTVPKHVNQYNIH